VTTAIFPPEIPEKLPPRPSLDYLRKEAKSRFAVLRLSDPSAQLAAAQLGLARAYGFGSWRALKAEVERRRLAAAPADVPSLNHFRFVWPSKVLVWDSTQMEGAFFSFLAAGLILTQVMAALTCDASLHREFGGRPPIYLSTNP